MAANTGNRVGAAGGQGLWDSDVEARNRVPLDRAGDTERRRISEKIFASSCGMGAQGEEVWSSRWRIAGAPRSVHGLR